MTKIIYKYHTFKRYIYYNGNGTGLTNIGYNNVIGKPFFFPADWNTAISNRPDLIVYATNTNLNNLSTFSKLNIDNLN